MQQRVITIVLVVGLLFGLMTLGSAMSQWRLPDNQQGYAPEQPIAYSHRLHAGELQIDCRFCHSAAGESQHAGIPSSDVCMKCHNFVTASFGAIQQERTRAADAGEKPALIISESLRPLYESLALDDELKPREGVAATSIEWVRVHDLPDYACFDHSAHVSAGVTCQHCHGPVESMERVRQVETLSMGWCVNCHREATETGIDGRAVHAATDCSVCHY